MIRLGWTVPKQKRNPAHFDEFARTGLSILELTDASNECRHGRLPLDTDAACGCFPGWEAEVSPLPVADKPARKAA